MPITKDDLLDAIILAGFHTAIEKVKEELIEEFLRDWRWGKVFEIHWKSRKMWLKCKCKNNPSTFWKWFENKWEARLRY